MPRALASRPTGTQCHSHWGGKGGQSATPDRAKIAKNQEKIRKNWGKEEKLGKKGKNQEISFTLSLLTDRAGYATDGTHHARHFDG